MRIGIRLLALAMGALMLQACVAGAVGTIAGAAVGGAVKVTAKGVGAACRVITGGHMKGDKHREQPPEAQAPNR